MPALVVWERLIVAGDDLRLMSTCMCLLRIFQVCITIPILYYLLHTDPTSPHPLALKTGCVSNEGRYREWYRATISACIFTMCYGVAGVLVECSIWHISGKGTPVEIERRRTLIPLCKFNMVPMLLVRLVGFVLSMYMITVTNKYCACVSKEFPHWEEWEREIIKCPTDRPWYFCTRVLVFTMLCDVFFPFVTFLVVMRKRIHSFYRRLRPPIGRERADIEESWRRTCKRFCECSALMTCYLFGGHKLTAGSYADVAMALADFVDDEGVLDIVPSDIAAALICLVNIQKQKQIDCRDQLLEEGGVLAKDKALVGKLLRTFRESQNAKKRVKSKHPTLNASASASVVIQTPSEDVSADIEIGLHSHETLMSDNDQWLEAAVLSHAEKNHQSAPEEINIGAEDESEQIEPHDRMESSSSSTTATISEIDNFQKMLSQKDAVEKSFKEALSFRLVHSDSAVFFEPTIRRVLSSNNYFDRLVLGEGAHYCRVALAAYSWMLYVWTKKCTGCCDLTAASMYGFCSCNPRYCHPSDNVVGDNMCGWKQTSVLKSIGINESDILYANFNNAIGVSPYLVLVDRKWNTIVLTIRGTLSLEDMISDVTISPEPLDDELCKEHGLDVDLKGEHCHAGMLAGAKWIYQDLKRHQILFNALESQEYSGFKFRIIGHSLGAGIATILGLMLRQKYPMLRCLCFSPPGCVFSEKIAKESRDYSWSYILNNDVVPRLSFDSLVKFRRDLIEMIARIKVPKHQIFHSHLMPLREKSVLHLPNKHLYRKESIPESLFWTEFESYNERQAQRAERKDRPRCQMTIPGQIVQMVRISENLSNVPCSCLVSCVRCIACCGMSSKTKRYKVRWTEAEDFSDIFISPTMMMDHFPYNIANALEAAAASYGITTDIGREELEETPLTQSQRSDVQEGTKKCS